MKSKAVISECVSKQQLGKNIRELVSNNYGSQRLSETVSSWIVGEVGDNYLDNLLDADFRNSRHQL